MSAFVERALRQAGLGALYEARLAGDQRRSAALLAAAADADLLLLGAIADGVRARAIGAVVRVHPGPTETVEWVRRRGSELDFVRAVAIARIALPDEVRIGVDWAETGLELAQVALGFGASDLTGPITRKSGALIDAAELKKVKGQGMVAASALKRREIAALLTNAGREAEFTDEPAAPAPHETAHA